MARCALLKLLLLRHMPANHLEAQPSASVVGCLFLLSRIINTCGPWCCSYQDQTGVGEGARFVLELEFIQCLANPHYLNCRSILRT